MNEPNEAQHRAELAGRDALIAQLRDALEEANRYVPRTNAAPWAVERDAKIAAALAAVPIPTVDLDAEDWLAIKRAAAESKWIPPEYMMNDWVSDVCAFLREGGPSTRLSEDTKAILAKLGSVLPNCSREDAHYVEQAQDHILALVADRDSQVGKLIGDDAYFSVVHDLLREWLEHARAWLDPKNSTNGVGALVQRTEVLLAGVAPEPPARDPRGDKAGNIGEHEDHYREDGTPIP